MGHSPLEHRVFLDARWGMTTACFKSIQKTQSGLMPIVWVNGAAACLATFYTFYCTFLHPDINPTKRRFALDGNQKPFRLWGGLSIMHGEFKDRSFHGNMLADYYFGGKYDAE